MNMLGGDVRIVQATVANDLPLTPKAFHNKAQGKPRSGVTLGYVNEEDITPRGLHRMLCNAFGVMMVRDDRQPRVRCATLG